MNPGCRAVWVVGWGKRGCRIGTQGKDTELGCGAPNAGQGSLAARRGGAVALHPDAVRGCGVGCGVRIPD